MANLSITSEISAKILDKKAIVSECKEHTCEHRVGTKKMYYLDENGNEKLDQPYYIVNLTLISERQLKKAIEFYQAGDFQKASNQGMTVQVSPEMAEKLRASITCTVMIEEVTNKDGEVMLGVKANKIRPTEASKGEKLNFMALLKKSLPVIEQATPEKAVA